MRKGRRYTLAVLSWTKRIAIGSRLLVLLVKFSLTVAGCIFVALFLMSISRCKQGSGTVHFMGLEKDLQRDQPGRCSDEL